MTAPTPTQENTLTNETTAPVIVAYKGFDKDFACQPSGGPRQQYKVGKTYKQDGPVRACKSGFHACEYPMDVFGYYGPVGSRFAQVEQSGEIARHGDDSKIASGQIHIKAEIGIPGLVSAAFEFIKSRCEPADAQHATGYSSASSATGNRSASSATGYRSASSATGNRSASSATGDSSASSATGDSSAASATGYSSASSATGYRSASLATGWLSSSEIKPDAEGAPLHAVAIATGGESKARAPAGSAIVLCHRNDDGEMIHIRASKVGDNGIKADTWYSLSASGEFVEVE